MRPMTAILLLALFGCRSQRAQPTPRHDVSTEGRTEAQPTACQSNADCAAAQICAHPSSQCGKDGNPGTCQERPEVCMQLHDPVCGCDGKVYDNACAAFAQGVDVSESGGCALPKAPSVADAGK